MGAPGKVECQLNLERMLSAYVVGLPAPGSPCGEGEMCRPSLNDGLSGF